MKFTRSQFLKLSVLAGLFPLVRGVTQVVAQGSSDPLPSWNNGSVKASIIKFVTGITTEGSPTFVPVDDRIATFDNDGTLWCEQPIIQVLSLKNKLDEVVAANPSVKKKQPFKAALEGDTAYLVQAGEEAIMEIIALTVANRSEEDFRAEVATFFKTTTHPKFKVPITQMTYLPMLELLNYLRANGFQTWICSGGGIDFIRVITQEIYGIPPQQVIGSTLREEFRTSDGKNYIWRLPQISRINDKTGKPVGIDLHIGQRPLFAAGNVRSGGDIAMLTYCQGRSNSFQLLIDHDDAEREFAYSEKDNASLAAALTNGWTVVSIKNDWQKVFVFQQ